LWIAGPGGTDRAPFLNGTEGETLLDPIVTDDGSVYFGVRSRSGTEVRGVSRDGSATRLLMRDVREFDIAPDGRTIVFAGVAGGAARIFRSSTEGGARATISDLIAFTPSIDTAGRRVAFYYIDSKGAFRLGVSSIDGGPLLADLPADPPPANGRIALTSEGIYLNTVPGDRANVWLLPLDGRPAKRITSFEDQLLFDFAISHDGATLAIVRGPRLRDAQLITGF